MDRRKLLRTSFAGGIGAATSVALGLGSQSALGQIIRTPRDGPKEAEGKRGWTTKERDLGFGATLTVFERDDNAKEIFSQHLTNPLRMVERSDLFFERIVLDHEIPNLGDESIAFRIMTKSYEWGNYVVVRVNNLLYVFLSWVGLDKELNFESPILKSVMGRTNPGTDLSMIELMGMLPTLEDVEPYGLTELDYETYTRTAVM